MASELLVFIAGQFAGRARQLPPERGLRRVLFRYDDDYLSDPGRTPLSVSVPVSATDFEISDWLDGLLPDDINVRRPLAGATARGWLRPRVVAGHDDRARLRWGRAVLSARPR